MALAGKTINGRLIISKSDSRPPKYRAIPSLVNGTRYASKKEAEYCEGLKHLERAGEIRNLHLQVPYDIVINGIKVCRYIADATYIDIADNSFHVVDVKGFRTKEYRLKKKLMKAVWDIEIEEV